MAATCMVAPMSMAAAFGWTIGIVSAAPRRVGMLMNGTHVRTAQLADEGKLTDQQAALSKAFTTARTRETVSWARELLGGNGVVADYQIARFFADAEALYSYEGTYQMRHLIVGKAITGFSAFV
jgi:alkylation response protein AidB-like acyl-CoA dehydrogenase